MVVASPTASIIIPRQTGGARTHAAGPEIVFEKKTRHLTFPVHNPFDGVEFEPRQSLKRPSTFNIKKLVQAATEEPAQDDPEASKIFFLAAGAGRDRRVGMEVFFWDRGVGRAPR